MDALDQSEQHRGGHQVRAPIGDEGQWKATYWGDPQRHTNVLEDLPHHHREYTRGQKEPVTVSCHPCDAPYSPQDDAKQRNDDAAANHSELFSDSRKWEVGELHRNVLSISKRAVEIALAKDPTCRYGTFGETNLQHDLFQIFVKRVLIKPCIKSAQLMLLIGVTAGAIYGPEVGALSGLIVGLMYDCVLTTPLGLASLVVGGVSFGAGLLPFFVRDPN